MLASPPSSSDDTASDCSAKQTPPTSSDSPPHDTMTPPLPAQPPAGLEEMAVDCIFCLSSLPLDSMPLTGQYEPVAQLVPCSHFMHDECLKPWTEIANTCPVCRVSFNEVHVHSHMTGPVLSTYQVVDKVQRVAHQGSDIQNNIGLAYEATIADVVREQRIWAAAWERLDADLEQPQRVEEEDDYGEEYYDRGVAAFNRQRMREQRMNRRRAVAAVQTGPGRNAFDESRAAWRLPTTRPRESFPHLEHQMSKEESDSWKMMELAEKLESSGNKRPRSSTSEDALLARMGLNLSTEPERDGRKFKRPRTRRDSQLPAINTRSSDNNNNQSNNNGEPRTGEAASALTVTPTSTASDAGSPPSGGIFTSILEGIGKCQEMPVVPAEDVSGMDLARMRPISPDRSSITSAISHSRSPTAIYSPASPPSSRPNSPDSDFRGRTIFSPSSPTRTPAHSPVRNRRKPWELVQPTSPPASRMQSPEGGPHRRQLSHSPGPSRAGESSASDSEPSKPRLSSITRESKADIVDMVSAALKPLYPDRISKENYTEINKKISRKMYRLVSNSGVMDKQQWHREIEKEVQRETQLL